MPGGDNLRPAAPTIDNVAVLTLQNCMQEVFEDGPKRDRRLWLGDLRLQALVNDVTFARHDLVRRCLYLLPGILARTAWYRPTCSCSRMSLRTIPFF